MITRRLGRTGPQVSALGLGCMSLSGVYGPADRAESIAMDIPSPVTGSVISESFRNLGNRPFVSSILLLIAGEP